MVAYDEVVGVAAARSGEACVGHHVAPEDRGVPGGREVVGAHVAPVSVDHGVVGVHDALEDHEACVGHEEEALVDREAVARDGDLGNFGTVAEVAW